MMSVEVVDGEGEVGVEAGDLNPVIAEEVMTEWMDSGAPAAFIENQSQIQRQAERKVGISATAETSGRGRRRPRVPLIRNPAKGSSGIDQR